jgi:transcriptional regulator with XRE-family HTH domain
MNGKIHRSKAELLRALGVRVRVLRAQRGWSQDTLAALSGLHRNYIGHVERAEVNVGLENLDKIACTFGLSLGVLLDLEPGVCDGAR